MGLRIERDPRNLGGDVLILDADGDTSITADTDDQIDVEIGGTDRLKYTAGAFAFQEATTISTTAGDLTLNPNGDVALSGNNLVQGAAFVEQGEIADPAAPAANNARLYARDNGSSKTQLIVRFPTGAVQVIATEP